MEYPRKKNFSLIYMRTILSMCALLFGMGLCSSLSACMVNPGDVSAWAGTFIASVVEAAILWWTIVAWTRGWIATGVIVTKRGVFPVNAFHGFIYKREFLGQGQGHERDYCVGCDGKVRSVNICETRNGNMEYYIGDVLNEKCIGTIDCDLCLEQASRNFVNEKSFNLTTRYWAQRGRLRGDESAFRESG